MAQRIPQKLHDLKNVLRPTDADEGRPLVWDRATQRYVYLTPPDNVGLWSYGFDAGAPLWLELVPVAGGTGSQDGTAAATGAEGTAQTGATGTTGAGTTGATGAEGTAQTGAGATAGTGTVGATGAEGTAEPGTGTGTAMAPGTAVAAGTQGSAETGTAMAAGTGTVSAAGAEGAAEPGTATGAATSSGTASATGSEGTAQTGTASATGTGTAAATGAQGSAEVGTATGTGGAPAAPITETFETGPSSWPGVGVAGVTWSSNIPVTRSTAFGRGGSGYGIGLPGQEGAGAIIATATLESQPAGTLSFWVYNHGPTDAHTFDVLVNGVNKYTSSSVPSGWTHITGIPYSAGSTAFVFSYDSTGADMLAFDDITWTPN